LSEAVKALWEIRGEYYIAAREGSRELQ
jgi:hypothetical protein